MLEKIREKWKKQVETVERKDIEYIKKHPKHWIGMMVFYIIFYIAVIVVGAIQDVRFIVFGLFLLVALYYIEKLCLDRYKKAFPKQN